MGRNGDLNDRTKAGLCRRLRRLEAQAGVGRWRPNDWPISDATIEGAIAILREHVGLDVLRECLAARPEDGGPAA
jgi:hypothetical protein